MAFKQLMRPHLLTTERRAPRFTVWQKPCSAKLAGPAVSSGTNQVNERTVLSDGTEAVEADTVLEIVEFLARELKNFSPHVEIINCRVSKSDFSRPMIRSNSA
jgi:hypothetical protein